MHREFIHLQTEKPTILIIHSLVNGAFTSVPVRRTISRKLQEDNDRQPDAPSPMTPPASGAPTGKPKRVWPEPVRNYVQRSFATENILPGVTRQEMEIKLKQIISDAAEADALYTTDWKTLALPQQIIHNEREKAVKLSEKIYLGQDLHVVMKDTNLKSPDPPSKKRKSSDWENTANSNDSKPPWRTTNGRNVFEGRISYPDKRQRNENTGKGSSKSHHNLDSRKKRFDAGASGISSHHFVSAAKVTLPSPEKDQGPVIGRCQDLEKPYLRLTTAPNPDTVRPLTVLEKTLDHLKKKWKKENNYSYICDQFKSLRQDLTVQHIRTDFTVNVYEIHARIALEKGDLGEYNQCQTQLRTLYSKGLEGHPTEFKAYRILYFIHTSNRTDMNDVLADLTTAEKNDTAVKHALDARSALALGNYHRFFQLYLETPNMGAYLMDMFVARERLAALSNICKS